MIFPMKRTLIALFWVATLLLFIHPGRTFALDNQPKPAYQLTSAGILPDHPLYKLKLLRDKMILKYLCDPLKIIDFYLKQTDKGILAAKLLVEKGKFA